MNTSRDRMDEFDRMQRGLILEAAEHGEDIVAATERIKQQTRPQYLKLLSDSDPAFHYEEPTVDNDAPVYVLRFPSPDYEPPSAA